MFTGRADVSWKPGGALPEAKVTLAGNGVKVVQQVQGNALPIAFDTLTLNAGLNNGRAQADWRIKLTNNGQFDGNIRWRIRRCGAPSAATSISPTSRWR